jgi:D-tyrosyl-tRNA(Tyr) deacylase
MMIKESRGVSCIRRKNISIQGMRLLVQRIKEAKIRSGEEDIARVGRGLCLFLGVAKGDASESADALAQKILELRIFEDENGKMNRSLRDFGGEVLVVSEFTLYGDCSRGRRPSFSRAAPPDEARRLYDYFVARLKAQRLDVATGKFQTNMEVTLVNDGPVTFILDV